MSKVCHAHCPGGGSVLGGALAVVAVAAIAAAVAQVVASAAQAVMVAGFAVLGAAVAAAIVFVRRSSRQVPLDGGAEIAQERRALTATRVQAALPARQPAAITAVRILSPSEAREMQEADRDR